MIHPTAPITRAPPHLRQAFAEARAAYERDRSEANTARLLAIAREAVDAATAADRREVAA